MLPKPPSNRTLKKILNAFIFYLAVYLIIGFTIWNFNPLKWEVFTNKEDEISRVFRFLFAFASCIIIGNIFVNPEASKKD